jgi:hypothetical protein
MVKEQLSKPSQEDTLNFGKAFWDGGGFAPAQPVGRTVALRVRRDENVVDASP